jgi:enterochelin esterase family protein
MNNVIDNLLDSNKIDPVIGVFIRPIDRNIEYMGEERSGYAQFVAQTVVPYIDENYRTIRSKDYRLTMGPSLGGNISGLIAYKYPDVIANSGWHSPALWVNSGEVAAMYLEEARDVKIYFNLGTYEDLGVDWDVFTSGLTELGYTFRWDVLHEGHSWGQWRATTDDILEFFFPAGSAPLFIERSAAGDFSAGPGFPNPFTEATVIPLTIERPGEYIVEVYNQTGQLVNTEAYLFTASGKYTIEIQGSGLRCGIYHVVIHNQKQILSQKITVQ